MSYRLTIQRSLFILTTMLFIAGCSVFNDGATSPTNTPARSGIREAVYVSDTTEQSLGVRISQIEIINAQSDLDTQVFAILANGDGNPAYTLFPSNQPGLPEPSLSLEDYPLYIGLDANTAGLWVVALKHQAYPVSEKLGQQSIIRQLAVAFDHLVLDAPQSTQSLNKVIAATPDLLGWFGEVDVLGEVSLPLTQSHNWSVGENEVESPDGGIRLHYTVSLVSGENIEISETQVPTDIAENGVPIEIPTENNNSQSNVNFTSVFDQDIPGYRRVISEDFSGAESTVEWFIGSDPTYAATIVNGAYQILLTALEERRDFTALSWGSIQDLVFDNYVVRARMRVLQDDVLARYGLWLHYQDDFNFLFFGMENTGRYRVARFQNSYTELSPWSSDPIINTGNGVNEIEVRLEDEQYTFTINGKAMVTTSDRIFKEGRIAFFCFSETVPATCHLERIEVWMPENAPFPKPTDTPTPN